MIKPNGIEICIDPGHGGNDNGASGFTSGVYEDNNNLKTGLILKDKLLEQGFSVVMTRTTDTYPSWVDRIKAGDKSKLYISIHNNAYSDINSNGYETLVFDKAPQDTLNIANAIHYAMATALKKYGVRDRGLKLRGDLAVLRDTKPHAVLLELGFVSNKTEEKLLTDDTVLNYLMTVLTKQICETFQVKYTEKTVTPPQKHEVVVTQNKILCNNIIVDKVSMVSIGNENFIKVKDLAKSGHCDVEWDANKKLVSLKFY